MGTDRTVVAGSEIPPLSLPGAQALGLPKGSYRDHLRPQDRDRLGRPAGRTGLGLWQDLSELPPSLAESRTWDKLYHLLLQELPDTNKIDWSRGAADGTKSRARGGGDDTDPNPTDRGKSGTEHHVRTDAQGIPLAVTVTGANAADVTQLLPLVDRIPDLSGEADKTTRPEELYADRAYDSALHREELRDRGIAPRSRSVGPSTVVGWASIDGSWSEPTPGYTPSASSGCEPIPTGTYTRRSWYWELLSSVCGSYEPIIFSCGSYINCHECR